MSEPDVMTVLAVPPTIQEAWAVPPTIDMENLIAR